MSDPLPPPPPEPAPTPSEPEDPKAQPKKAERGTIITFGVIGAFILGAIVFNAVSGNDHKGGGSGNSLDQRTCEIARDIAGSYNVTDTLEESRQRLADLYDGYGKSASPAIAAGIREWVSGLTSGDYEGAAQGVSAVDSACSAEGF